MPSTQTSAPLRVLYVEDDPALRGILSTILTSRKDLQVVATAGSPSEALTTAAGVEFDVALLDLALGDDEISGIELGITLRERRPEIGVVVLSQHQVPAFLTRFDDEQRHGWSFILKRADLHPNYLSDVLHSTARGLNVVDPAMVKRQLGEQAPAVSHLTQRQRDIMALASEGLEAPTIGKRLDLTPGVVRQELSRTYQVLVPDPPEGADLRTLAVLRYVRETRDFGQN
ncbi:MAG: response regulator [Candidatus Nanopelagicales bacterium]